MSVWAVTMIRDELDIIEHTLRHMASEGVAGIIVADNLSTDGTWEWLNDNDATFPCQIRLQRDEEVGYYQSRKMTALAQQAFELGAEWVIPFDADEFWFNGSEDRSVADTLADVRHKYDCIDSRLHNYFGTFDDDTALANPVERITRRDPKPAPLPKVMIRRRPDVVIEQGNHNATWSELAHRATLSVEVGHFPWRSYEQFERKVRNGYEAYQAADLSGDLGVHWRNYGQILLDGGSAALQEVFFKWFFNPEMRLEDQPIPYRRFDPPTNHKEP